MTRTPTVLLLRLHVLYVIKNDLATFRLVPLLSPCPSYINYRVYMVSSGGAGYGFHGWLYSVGLVALQDEVLCWSFYKKRTRRQEPSH